MLDHPQMGELSIAKQLAGMHQELIGEHVGHNASQDIEASFISLV